MTDVIFIFHFGLFLPFYPLNNPKNQKFLKMKKRDIILNIYAKHYDYMIYGSWDMVHSNWTDGWNDGWTEKVIYRCGCPT